MLRCVIVDDEPAALEVLTSYIQMAPQLELAGSFRDPVKALEFLQTESVAIGFFDINMPRLTGLQLSQLLREKDLAVVFCTAHSEYASESYELEAADYLLKPFAFDRFMMAVNRAEKRLRRVIEREDSKSTISKQVVYIKCGSKIHQINVDDILYAKKDGHYMMIVTTKGSFLSRMSVAELLELVGKKGFIQVHKSFVVALAKINLVDRQYLVVNNEEIPIGGNFRKNLLEQIKYSGS